MRINTNEGNIILEGITDFNIQQTLECGQCFHFDEVGEMEYGYVCGDRLLHIKQEGDTLIFFNTTKDEVCDFWMDVLDLNRDYSKIKRKLLKEDNRLSKAIELNYGIRIMNQNFEETLMSFIISQTKTIPHIKKIVKDISFRYGERLGKIKGVEFYSFPNRLDLGKITVEEYTSCKTGFRASYLADAAYYLCNDLRFQKDYLLTCGYDEAKKILKEIKGVGDKVANCVLLFSLGYRNAFPVDVWIKRMMEEIYFNAPTSHELIMQKAETLFGEYGGYAQQYLFSYGRKNKIYKKLTKN